MSSHQKGQAAVEFIIALPLLLASMGAGMFFCHAAAEKLWVDHQLYQALICMAEGRTRLKCQTKLKINIQKFLWIGKFKKIHLQKITGESKWSGQVVIQNIYGRIISKTQIHL